MNPVPRLPSVGIFVIVTSTRRIAHGEQARPYLLVMFKWGCRPAKNFFTAGISILPNVKSGEYFAPSLGLDFALPLRLLVRSNGNRLWIESNIVSARTVSRCINRPRNCDTNAWRTASLCSPEQSCSAITHICFGADSSSDARFCAI